MTTYQKDLAARIGERYGAMSTAKITELLFEIGVLDHTLCKVLAVREFVLQRTREGAKKIDSMWEAAEHFCCTYEYVRKCIYYYTDVNLV